nr:DNA helicase [Tanacetum cinerariifolium]
MWPDEGQPLRFLQLYIHDTANEVNNRMANFGNEHESVLKKEIVEGLIQLLDSHNALVQLFHTARNKYMEADIPEFKVMLYNVIGTRQYELPTAETIGAIVFAETSGIYDAILRGDRDANNLGLCTVLTTSFTGGPRYMYAHYLDALAICRVHRSLSFFITFTCNAKWPEIEEFMEPFPQLTTADRVDIVDRVFEKKNVITLPLSVTQILLAMSQQRGLPHCHSLIWIDTTSKVNQAIDVDLYVYAELLNPKVDVKGHRIISELMIHGPCGYANRNASCMKYGSRCNHNFPKAYRDKTYIDKDGFVHYRRRDTGIQTQRQSVWLHNKYVFPYNRTLCMRYYAHINVKYYVWTMLIKYLFKYISKGTDRVIANVIRPTATAESTTNVPGIQVDEIKNYIKVRYIGPHEACWRILDFPIHYRNPYVQALATNKVACEALGLIGGDEEWTMKLIFIYGHGGTGKTFLWKAITTTLRSEEKIVLTVASSGIASLLLPSGRTAHSQFQLPLNLKDESTCDIKKNSQLADLLRRTNLIIWDEAPMNDRRCFEALYRCLKGILDSPHTLFGGCSIMLGGDFRQTLPVKKKASKPEIIDASITSSYLWKGFNIYTLTQNMRLYQSDLTKAQKQCLYQFSTWLLDIGDGNIGTPDESETKDIFNVHIPVHLCISDSDTELTELINFIYDDMVLQTPTVEDLQKKAIVAPTNESENMINAHVLRLVNHQQHMYLSSKEAIPHGNDGGETELLYPTEYLNSLNFSSFPPHML